MKRLVMICCFLGSIPARAADVAVLTYHDVTQERAKDEYAVSMDNFRRQLEYLKRNGYQPISFSQYRAAVRDRKALPEKSVMLTFDDGLRSYRDKILPLLKQYGYPSVLSVVSSWADGEKEPTLYHGKLLRWDDLRQLKKEPLVEIVSHSHDLHRYVVSSPLGSKSPSATTRVYHNADHRYEPEPLFQKRIQQDLATTRKRFSQELGAEPPALTWPYGEYDPVTMQIARAEGFRFQLTLDEGKANRQELPNVRRYMVLRDHAMADFKAMLEPGSKVARGQRFVEFNLDVFAHVSKKNHNLLIRQLVHRAGSLGVNTIVITPFSADGRSAYFANEYLPVAHDLLNAIIDRARARLKLKHVYLRFPAGTESLPDNLFADLARTSRFTAVLFDRPPTSSRRSTIQRVLSRYRMSVRIGSWRAGDTGLDISVIDATQLDRVSSLPGTVLVYLDRDEYLTTGGLAEALKAVRDRDVPGYGYGSFNYMAGGTAPEELAGAMAYRAQRAADD